jgi:hypothetical protein
MRLAFSLSLILTLLVPVHLFANAGQSKYHQQQSYADQLYQNGEYGEAMRQYLPLAKKGDSFSQYRVSYMYLEGQGTETDLIESFAWASLAAQNRDKQLIEYRDKVGSLVPEKQHRKALRKVDYYTRKWGNMAIAEDAIKGARTELRNCTGSRVGSRCNEVYAAEMPNFWGIDPGAGGGSGGDGGSAAASGSVSSARGSGGGSPTRDMAYYEKLRQSIRDLNRHIEENAGTVELGEFEVIEDTPEPKGDGK